MNNDRLYKSVNIFLELECQTSNILFAMGLHMWEKYDVKALKPYTLGSAYSKALSFEAKKCQAN